MDDQIPDTLNELEAAGDAAHIAHLHYIAVLRDRNSPLAELEAASDALGDAHDRFVAAGKAWAADFEARFGHPPFISGWGREQ